MPLNKYIHYKLKITIKDSRITHIEENEEWVKTTRLKLVLYISTFLKYRQYHCQLLHFVTVSMLYYALYQPVQKRVLPRSVTHYKFLLTMYITISQLVRMMLLFSL